MWKLDPDARNQLTDLEQNKSYRLKNTDCRILALLAARAGESVPKEDLFEAAWKGRVVTESSLSQAIAQLRRVLGDSGREQKVIKTTPKHGYMLLHGKVELVRPNKPGDGEPDDIVEDVQVIPVVPAAPGASPVLPGLRASVQVVAIASLSILSLFLLYWLVYIFTTQKSVDEPQWIQSGYHGVDYYFSDDHSGRELYEAIADIYPDVVDKIFLSDNPEEIFVACVYKATQFGEMKTMNLSFSSDYAPEEIKRAVHEKCQ